MTKIRVKLGNAEAEVESDPEHLREAIELIPEVVSKLPRAGRDAPEVRERSEPAETPAQAVSADFPVIALDKGD